MIYLFILGRILLGGFFIISGINHIKDHKGLTAYATSQKIPMPAFAVALSGVLLILGGLGIVLGVYTSVAIILLEIFLVPTTFMLHRFWEISDPMARMNQRINFKKNLALIGALIMIAMLPRPWPASVEIMHQKIGNVPAESENVVSTALFTCDGSLKINAQYYSDSVNLILSDGRTISLPQVAGADGVRYANTDESTVFWSKDMSANLLENGINIFKNCAAEPVEE